MEVNMDSYEDTYHAAYKAWRERMSSSSKKNGRGSIEDLAKAIRKDAAEHPNETANETLIRTSAAQYNH
jgi:hypothetical protein